MNLIRMRFHKIIHPHLVYQSVLRQLIGFLVAAKVQFGRRQNMGNRSEPMEHHGAELNDQNQRKEEHEHQSDRFQLQVLLGNVHLCIVVEICD